MLRKVFIPFLLIVFLNYICGCTITRPETESISNINLEEVELVKSVVLTNGEIIKFDEQGGHFRTFPERIIGRGENGKELKLPINYIEEFRTKTFPLEKPFNLILLKDVKVIEAVDKKNILYKFENGGAVFNTGTKEIIGSIKTKKFSLPLDNVVELYGKSPELISKEEVINDTSLRIQQIHYNKHLAFNFDENGGHFENSSFELIGISEQGDIIKLNPNQILYVNIEKIDYATSTIATMGIIVAAVAGLFIIAAAAKQSCPFIYSYNGEKYVFDAEPLGGATSKILQRSELSKLNYLKESEGKYKLLVRNEVEETQYVDAMELFIVDHKKGDEIYPDLNGNLFAVNKIYSPVSVVDEENNSLLNFVKNDDEIQWQTLMAEDSSNLTDKKRHLLKFTFPKPANAKKVNLIINAGTSLWGSNMIREMISLYGENVEEWYNSINEGGLTYKSMMSFLQNEELYQLKLYAESEGKWLEKEVINGGGPFISEPRIYSFDIPDIKGDSLVLRINPPVGFWTLNYIAVNYDDVFPIIPKKSKIISVTDFSGNSIDQIIEKKDEVYFEIPDKKTGCFIEFNVPEKIPGLERTIFVNTSGYYKLHLSNNLKSNLPLLYSFSAAPGLIIEYSKKKYIEWRTVLPVKYEEVLK